MFYLNFNIIEILHTLFGQIEIKNYNYNALLIAANRKTSNHFITVIVPLYSIYFNILRAWFLA